MRHREIPISKDAFRVRMPATGAPTEQWVEASRSTKIRRDLSGPVAILFIAQAILGERCDAGQAIGFVFTLGGGMATSLLKDQPLERGACSVSPLSIRRSLIEIEPRPRLPSR